MAERVDAVALDHAAAHALKDVVEQPADATRAKGHARFPVRPPAVEGDVERAEDDVLVAEDDELVVHVRRDLDQGMLGRAEDADQLDAGLLQPDIVVAVGQRHLAPVDDALDPHAVPVA